LVNTITSIEPQKRKRGRLNLFLDGVFALGLGAEIVESYRLKPGQTLSESQIEELVRADQFQQCLDAASHYLSYRPRSEKEIRGRLRRRGFDQNIIEGVLLKLKEQRLIDDASFAQFWKENRESFSPRSRLLLRLELKEKGVDPETAEAVTQGVDEEEGAYQAARKKASSLKEGDYQAFRRKLGAFLRRRGFSYEVINRTLERVWRELSD